MNHKMYQNVLSFLFFCIFFYQKERRYQKESTIYISIHCFLGSNKKYCCKNRSGGNHQTVGYLSGDNQQCVFYIFLCNFIEDKRNFTLEKQIPRNIVFYRKCHSQPLSLQATQIINHYLNSMITAKHNKYINYKIKRIHFFTNLKIHFVRFKF